MKLSTASIAVVLPIMVFVGSAWAFQGSPPCLSNYSGLYAGGSPAYDPLWGWTMSYNGGVDLACVANPSIPKPGYFCRYCVLMALYSRPLPNGTIDTKITGSEGGTYDVACGTVEYIDWVEWADITDNAPAAYTTKIAVALGPCVDNMDWDDYDAIEDSVYYFYP